MNSERITVALNMTNVISLITIAASCAWFVSEQSRKIEEHDSSILKIENRLRETEEKISTAVNDIRWIRQHLENASTRK
jgi:hypothetical protein